MENASKALLIAGAVLIVIVLISVGMLIVSQANKITDQTEGITTSQAAQTFNNQFTNYTGTQSGSSVKTLLTLIATNNATNKDTGTNVITVKLTDSKSAANTPAHNGLTDVNETAIINKYVTNVPNSAKYTVETSEFDTSGYIKKITITRTK